MNELQQKKLLIVDDEPNIRRMIESFLRKDGYARIYHAQDCTAALEMVQRVKPDLMILDVMLPDGDGFSLLRAIRQMSNVPVLFLSARGEDEDRLLGLGLGADDYIVKPFLPRELLLRMKAVLRRVYAPPVREQRPVFQLGERMVNLESGTIRALQQEYALTAKELLLLSAFYEQRNRIVTNDALCQAAWGDDYYGYENTLMVHIRRIREKIEPLPSSPQYLLTVRGLGYKLLVQDGAVEDVR